MILTVIFAMVGCNANSKPDKKAVESSSANAIVDITQAEDLFEKTEDETVEKSTFAEEKTQMQSADSNGRFCGAKRTRCGASGLIYSY